MVFSFKNGFYTNGRYTEFTSKTLGTHFRLRLFKKRISDCYSVIEVGLPETEDSKTILWAFSASFSRSVPISLLPLRKYLQERGILTSQT